MTIVAADIVAFSDAYWTNASLASEIAIPRIAWPPRSLCPCIPAVADFELQQRLKVARQRYANFTAPDERALLMFDGTFFGSGGEGFVVTNRAIYIKPYSSEPVTIERAEIGTLSVRRDGPHTVLLLPDRGDPVASFASEATEHLLIRDFFQRIGSGRFTHTVQDLLCLIDPSVGFSALEGLKQAGIGPLVLDGLRAQLSPDATATVQCGPLVVIDQQVVIAPDHLLSLRDIDEVIVTQRLSERHQAPVNEDDRRTILTRLAGAGRLAGRTYTKLLYKADLLGFDLEVISRAQGRIPVLSYEPQAAMLLSLAVSRLRELGIAVTAPQFTPAGK